nr:593_t:CDS:10 [Entrophospora candida]
MEILNNNTNVNIITSNATNDYISMPRLRSMISEDSVYYYSLYVAYLSHLITPGVNKSPPSPILPPLLSPQTPPIPLTSPVTSLVDDKSVKRKSSNGSFISNIFTKDDKKKLPKGLIKELEKQLKLIINEKDPNPIFKNTLLKSTLLIFYQLIIQPDFKQQLKLAGGSKIEAIIVIFLKSAQKELKNAKLPPNKTWQTELTEQVSVFVGILSECLKNSPGQFQPSLLNTLAITRSKSIINRVDDVIDDMELVKVVQAVFNIPENRLNEDIKRIKSFCTEQAAVEDLKLLLNNVNRNEGFPACKDDFETIEGYNAWKSIESKTILDIMATMFKFNPNLAPKPSSNEVLSTLLTSPSTKRVSTGSPLTSPISPTSITNRFTYPGGSHVHPDVNSKSSNYFDHIHNPNSSLAPSRNSESQHLHPNYHRIPSNEINDKSESFTFIPPTPRLYYKFLMNRCIDYEITRRSEQENNSGINIVIGDRNPTKSHRILSKSTLDLLNQCALRWRVSPGFKWLQYLNFVRTRFDFGDPFISLEHIKEGFYLLREIIRTREISTWTISDKRELLEIFSGIHDSLLKWLKNALDSLYEIETSEFEPAFFLLNNIYDTDLFRVNYPDVSPFYHDLRERIKKVAFDAYQQKKGEIFNNDQQQQGINAVQKYIILIKWIKAQVSHLHEKYPEPLMRQLDVVRLVFERQVLLLAYDMNNSKVSIMNSVKFAKRERDENNKVGTKEEGDMVVVTMGEEMNEVVDRNGNGSIYIAEIFDLYREILLFKKLHEDFFIGSMFQFGIEGWFEPYINKWLDATNDKTRDWIDSVIRNDVFKPVSPTDYHSSSVVDLFTLFNQSIDSLKNLNWPNQHQFAKFMTCLSKTVCKALEQYCGEIDRLYKDDLSIVENPEKLATKQSAWYVSAKTAIASKKVLPFDIKPKLCIKLNNLEAAYTQLDSLYNSMDVDHIAEILNNSIHSKTSEKEKSYLYTLKIVRAENLVALDNNGLSDTYCIINDENNVVLAHTRVIYETLNPRWDEAFDISINSDSIEQKTFMITVWDQDQVSSDAECGKAYFKLDIDSYDDFLAHDLWLDLKPQGRVLVRISMEGEKDDIQFYFGKAFRSLKRARDDMIRTTISPYLSQCLSREVVKSLLRPSSTTATSLKQIFKETAAGKDTLKSKKSDLEIESGIHPLFDYFDKNLNTLINSLNTEVFNMVMTKVWKEIETIIEEILTPPLSDRPSNLKLLDIDELDIVYKWLKFLEDYLLANGNGIPKEIIYNQKYQQIMKIQQYYMMDKESLKQEYLHIEIGGSLSPRRNGNKGSGNVKKKKDSVSKSVVHQRSIDTIEQRKSEKRRFHLQKDDGEIILRILRMHSGTKSFLKKQLEEQSKKLKKESLLKAC